MLLLLRRFKHELFMKAEFRKYLAYGFGELMLVVIGILVALQIDNWNEDRKEQATLQAYLQSIARNMREDLVELKPLRSHRHETIWAASKFVRLRNRESFEIDEIFFLDHMRELGTMETFLSANTSGFEALKVSGVLDRLQGSGIEHLMSDYYDTVSQISLLETSLYDAVRSINLDLNLHRPLGLEDWAVRNPSALSSERFQDLQPVYAQIVNSPGMSSLADAQFRNIKLLLLYDSLQVLGEAFIRAAGAGPSAGELPLPRTPVAEWKEGLGLPVVVDHGRPAWEAYWLAGSSANNDKAWRFDSLQQRGDGLHIDYRGGFEWAAVFWLATTTSFRRPYLDFSRFTQLQLELKGDQGGERVLVHVKDADYPDDIAPIGRELTLSNEWQSHAIDLAGFSPTDFSRLHVVLGFLIAPADEPLGFSIRNARYE